METTFNTLITLTFFAPMLAMVLMNLFTHRSAGPELALRRAELLPLPPARRVPQTANQPRYLEAA